MDIDTDNKEISILQLSDSFFPTGLYATSSGLEALSQTKKLRSKDIFQFISMQLHQVMGPSDCTAMGYAHESCKKKDIIELLHADESLYYMKLIEETRIASTRSGNQLLKCVSTFAKNKKMLKEYQIAINKSKATGVYAVSFGVVTSSLNIPKKKAGMMLLYGFTVSIVGAAMRLGILQHLEGQKIIHELAPLISHEVSENINRPISSMWQFAPSLDILQMKHEALSSKMFIT
ncbi:MAG TPA: urease accessory UreF family protein [Nitrososphaeraceae archaeon]|jgi:urease accessory protein|nr:urease accessory UreF family protein [Nitrososphaeraceae archaeon]